MLELLASGMTHKEILADYEDLEEADLQACLLFASRMMEVKSVSRLAKHRLSEAEFEAKILAAQASKISYHFKGDEFNDMANRLLNKEGVDLDEYKIIDE